MKKQNAEQNAGNGDLLDQIASLAQADSEYNPNDDLDADPAESAVAGESAEDQSGEDGSPVSAAEAALDPFDVGLGNEEFPIAFNFSDSETADDPDFADQHFVDVEPNADSADPSDSDNSKAVEQAVGDVTQQQGSDVDAEDEHDLKVAEAIAAPWTAAQTSDFFAEGGTIGQLVNSVRRFAGQPAATETIFTDLPPNTDDRGNPREGDGRAPASIGLGATASLLGQKGLMGLGKMMATGTSALNEMISQRQTVRLQGRMSGALAMASTSLAQLQQAGLTDILDVSSSAEEQDELMRQFFSTPGNRQALDSIVANLDSSAEAAGKLMRKQLENGVDPDLVAQQVVSPLTQFEKDHEKLLEKIKYGDSSLKSRLEGSITNLFNLLKDMALSAAGAFRGGQPQRASSSQPSLG